MAEAENEAKEKIAENLIGYYQHQAQEWETKYNDKENGWLATLPADQNEHPTRTKVLEQKVKHLASQLELAEIENIRVSETLSGEADYYKNLSEEGESKFKKLESETTKRSSDSEYIGSLHRQISKNKATMISLAEAVVCSIWNWTN